MAYLTLVIAIYNKFYTYPELKGFAIDILSSSYTGYCLAN